MADSIAVECRKNLLWAKKNDRHNREACRDNLKFLNGEQWDATEVRSRGNGSKRLMLTADMLNGPVNQVVNGVRQNKPGPLISPAGGGADKDSALIMEGIMRRVDYENTAWNTFASAMEYGTGGNFGCWEMTLGYRNDRSFERSILVKSIPDANETVWFGPSKERDRSDAPWAIQLCVYTYDDYKREFPKSEAAKRGGLAGVIDLIVSLTDDSTAGWVTADGLQVAKYWKLVHKEETLRLYTDGIARFDSELNTGGADPDPEVAPRMVDRTRVKWYIVNGSEKLKEGDWDGSIIPLFPVYGQERWIEGKRYITAMIQLAKQAQQAFNYAFTGACETLASTTKSPWIGLVGQFKTKLDQWRRANKEIPAFIEYDEVLLQNGQVHVAPPQKNVGEPPIQAFLQFCSLCVNAIQRATSVFDPSLGRSKSEQSGKAIEALDQQSVSGNFHWSDSLTIALCKYYKAMCEIIQAEYDQAQVIEIIRPSGDRETAIINQEYSKTPGEKKFHNIANGIYSFAVSVGNAYDTERKAIAARVKDLVKSLPPQMIAASADLIIQLYDLGHIGDEIADRITPPQYRDQNDPKGAMMKLMEAQQQIQEMTGLIQKLQFELKAKLPELESRERIAALNALANIDAAAIKAGDSHADRETQMLEMAFDHTHDADQAAADREHAAQINKEQLESQEKMAQQQAQNQQSGE